MLRSGTFQLVPKLSLDLRTGTFRKDELEPTGTNKKTNWNQLEPNETSNETNWNVRELTGTFRNLLEPTETYCSLIKKRIGTN